MGLIEINVRFQSLFHYIIYAAMKLQGYYIGFAIRTKYLISRWPHLLKQQLPCNS